MSGTLQRLVLKGRNRALVDAARQQPSTAELTTTSLHFSSRQRESSLRCVDAASPPVPYPQPQPFPFSSIQHFNVVLGEAVRNHRWRDVATLEDLLAPHYDSTRAAAAKEVVDVFIDEQVTVTEGPGVRPSVETFQLLMAGRLHVGDWESALRYFAGSQHELLPVTDATLRMALRAYQHADAPHSIWRSALHLFRSFQHRVRSAETAEILLDILLDSGRLESILQVYVEIRGVVPLDMASLAVVVEAAKGTGEWMLAMQLASSAVASTLSAHAVQPIVASGLGAAINAQKYECVQQCIRVLMRKNADVLDEDACLLGAKASAMTQHIPTVLELLEFIRSRKHVFRSGYAAFHSAQNIALIGLHHAVLLHCSSVTLTANDESHRRLKILLSAARTVQHVAYSDDSVARDAGSLVCHNAIKQMHWVDALSAMKRSRNADALMVLHAVTAMRSQSQWESGMRVLNFAAVEHEHRYQRSIASHKKSKAHVPVGSPVSPITVWAIEQVLRSIPESDSLRAAAFLHRVVELSWIPRSVCRLLLDHHDIFLRSADAAAWLLEALDSPQHANIMVALDVITSPLSAVASAEVAMTTLMETVLMMISSCQDSDALVNTRMKSFVEKEIKQLFVARASPLPWVIAMRNGSSVVLRSIVLVKYPAWLVLHGRASAASQLYVDLFEGAAFAPTTSQEALNILNIVMSIPLGELPPLHADHSGFAQLLLLLAKYVVDAPVPLLVNFLSWLESPVFCELEYCWWLKLCNIVSARRGQRSTLENSSALSVCMRAVHRLSPPAKGEDVAACGELISEINAWVSADLQAAGGVNLQCWLEEPDQVVVAQWVGRELRERHSADFDHSFLFAASSMERAPESTLFSCVCLYVKSVVDRESVTSDEWIVTLLAKWMDAMHSTKGAGTRSGREVLISERMMKVLEIGQSRPVMKWLVSAHLHSLSATSKDVLRCALRVHRTWLSEGRRVSHENLFALLAIPTNAAEFSDSWNLVQASLSLNTAPQQVQWNKELILHALSVMKVAHRSRILSTLYLHKALLPFAAVLQDSAVSSAFIEALSEHSDATVVELTDTESEAIRNSSLWKSFIQAPHTVAAGWGRRYFLHSPAFRLLLATAASRRPHSVGRVVIDIVEGSKEQLLETVVLSSNVYSEAAAILTPLQAAMPASANATLQWWSRVPQVDTAESRVVAQIVAALSNQLSFELRDDVLMSSTASNALGRFVCSMLSSPTTINDVAMDLIVRCCVVLRMNAKIELHRHHENVMWRAIERSCTAPQAASVVVSSLVGSFADASTILQLIIVGANFVPPTQRFPSVKSSEKARRKDRMWRGAAVAHMFLDVLLHGSELAARFPSEGSRVKVVDVSVALGRWRQLAVVFASWASAGVIPKWRDSVFAESGLDSWMPLIATASAAWSTRNDVWLDEVLQDLVTVTLSAVTGNPTADRRLARRAINAAHTAAVGAAAEVKDSTAFDPVAMAVTAASLAIKSVLPTAPTSTSWMEAVRLIIRDGLSPTVDAAATLRDITERSSGAVTPFLVLRALLGPHVPHRVPTVLCTEALGTCPTWSDGLDLVRKSVRSLNDRPPMAVQRYLSQMVLESMRRGVWTCKALPSGVSATVPNIPVSQSTLCWETAAALLTLSTKGNFKHLPQRLLTEAMRHSFRNPDQMRVLFLQFQRNRYSRVEGINHLLSLLRCAKVNRVREFLPMATEALAEIAPTLSASNRRKVVMELGQVGRLLLDHKEFNVFRDGVEKQLQDPMSCELIAMW
jgi:hypothetical protein